VHHEACGIRDHSSDYEAANAVVLGVSPDEPARLRKFADKHGLPFTLLGDPEHGVLEAYGVWKEKKMYGKTSLGVERTTFVIDPEGVVRRVLPRVKPKEHDELVLGALEGLLGKGRCQARVSPPAAALVDGGGNAKATVGAARSSALRPQTRVRGLRVAVALAFAGGIALSPRLWLSDARDYPLAPVAEFLPHLGFPLDVVLLAALGASLSS
jgi:peroxiredoxin